MTAPLNNPRTPPYKPAGAVLLLICALVLAFTWTQFRGTFEDRANITLVSMEKTA